jgi:hypothetical protein
MYSAVSKKMHKVFNPQPGGDRGVVLNFLIEVGNSLFLLTLLLPRINDVDEGLQIDVRSSNAAKAGQMRCEEDFGLFEEGDVPARWQGGSNVDHQGMARVVISIRQNWVRGSHVTTNPLASMTERIISK